MFDKYITENENGVSKLLFVLGAIIIIIGFISGIFLANIETNVWVTDSEIYYDEDLGELGDGHEEVAEDVDSDELDDGYEEVFEDENFDEFAEEVFEEDSQFSFIVFITVIFISFVSAALFFGLGEIIRILHNSSTHHIVHTANNVRPNTPEEEDNNMEE